jgi:hypothetical protein
VNSIWHWVAHRLGWNYGHVESWLDGERLMIGFRCDTCGSLTGVHESFTTAKETK